MKVSKKTIESAENYLFRDGKKPTNKKTLAYIATVEARIASLLSDRKVLMPENQKLLYGKKGEFHCKLRKHVRIEGDVAGIAFRPLGDKRIRNWIPANEPVQNVYKKDLATTIVCLDISKWESAIPERQEVELDLRPKTHSHKKVTKGRKK